jgi:hypothetical protein
MRVRITSEFWKSTLFAAIGATACGGSTGADRSTTDAGPGGAGGKTSWQTKCLDPTPMSGGFVRCGHGFVHRPSVAECPANLPTRPTGPSPGIVDGGLETCLVDADCDAWSYGRCGNTPDITFSPPYYCVYGCVRDEDCGTGRICACGPLVGTCIQATCTRDSECGQDVCGQVTLPGPCGPVPDHFECRVAGTECAIASDCGQGETCQAGSCAGAGGVCGRPFLVDSENRRATAFVRTDWASGAHPARQRTTPRASIQSK